MGFQKLPTSLDMTKLFLDVRLDAIPILGKDFVDLTGRKTFTVGMMRDNKGFGITDINIETKASLQPIVEITFKDLYGNTVFETEKDTKLDYSLLFDWPPPKFRFTFKGYLGRPVTWIMNLKKTSTRYGSNDGSYEIKATFVPNQWGFLADIPFLYLLAKKKLKRDMTGEDNKNSPKEKGIPVIDSIFDIIKVGKRVETKTKQATKEFDKLQKQLAVLKGNAIDGLINKDFEPNEVIDGSVSGRQPIKGLKGVYGQNDIGDFTKIKITLPSSLSATEKDSIKFQETLKELKSDGSKIQIEHRKIIALIGGASNSGMETIGVFAGDQKLFQEKITAGAKIIDDNLKLIDIETKRRLFETTSVELGMVTVSEVFSRVAADGAFILGSILQAGYNGYNTNKPIRDKDTLNDKPLIGKYFPLTIDDSGEQIPATEAGIGEKGCEMEFVLSFIGAISEGIAENKSTEGENGLDSNEAYLSSRINNLEIINPNPYKDLNGQQFLETLLVRSGIAAYVTRSFDPNQPGDYNTNVGVDNDSPDKIKKLVEKELKNITDSILSSLSTEDYNDVKKFCHFINNLFDVNGEGLLFNSEEPPAVVDISKFSTKEIKEKPVFDLNKKSLGTVDDFFKRFVDKNSIFCVGNQKGLTDSIRYDDLDSELKFGTSKYLYNNDTLWMIPIGKTQPDKNKNYSFVVFNNPSDQSSISAVQNNETDSEFNNKDKQEDATEPLGIIKLSNANDDEKQNPDEIERLEALNHYIPIPAVLDYRKLKNLSSVPIDKTGYPIISEINLNKTDSGVYYHPNPSKPDELVNKQNIGNGLTYTVYTHTTTDDEPLLTWGLFRPSSRLGDVRGRNQRIFLRSICVDLENRMTKLEDEKNNVLSQVLGKAQSNANSLYIQMHHIFHQWGVLGFESDTSNKNSDGSDKVTEQQIPYDKLALKLESDYANIVEVDSQGNITKKSNIVEPNFGGGATSMGFRYDFPTERINPPSNPAERTNVAHSIINIEPLYKPNANTTLLNIIQQLCTKNNFMFIPIPGNVDYTNISEIFKPQLMTGAKVGNVFHVLFTPTPENRAHTNTGLPLNLVQNNGNDNFKLDAFEIEFGSPTNSVVKNVDVSTEDSKPTAESILNLQRLVDKDNSNKAVTTDCSTLSVMEGRSYKMKVEMIGNGQISPMQYFYVPKMPLFSGLYQIMNVSHSIKPNDMTTTLEGIKMRFDTGSNMKGIGPITLESLKALGTPSNITEPIATNGGSGSPYMPAPTNMYGVTLPTNIPVTSDDGLDLIPGTYLNSKKQPITLVQINKKPVEINTAKAYMPMYKAAKADGIYLSINSCFRPQWGPDFSATSSKGVHVTAQSQEALRIKYLLPKYKSNPNQVLNPKGALVPASSDTLRPQSAYFDPLVSAPGGSDHGDGMALDLNTGTRRIGGKNSNISIMNDTADKERYIWLVKNSWKYGFVRTVNTEEWHFTYNPNWAKMGPYGGFIGQNKFPVNTVEQRNTVYFFTDFGLSNLVTSSL